MIDWVATHRKHHQFSDIDGDPHSPHVGHGSGWRGALSGLAHAHIGWVFSDMEVADESRYAKDLLADPLIRFVDRTFVLWVLVGLAAAFGLGVALTGTVSGGLAALLWGGAARIFLVHHATFSINSLCHFFGKRDWETKDESRNLAWLAIPTWGEAWHNNHHAFPTSYRHGLRRWQIDPSAGIIRVLEMIGPGLGRRSRRPGALGAHRAGTRVGRLGRTEALRRQLRQAFPQRPFAVAFWDGTSVEATEPGAPTFTFRSPQAVAHVLRAPGELGMGRAYTAGLIEVDDLEGALQIVDTFEPPRLSLRQQASLGVALVRACGIVAPPRAPSIELRLRGERHTLARDRRAVRHHYDAATSSSRCSSMTR